ncbi:MAG: ferrous iron transport protein A [Roseiflexaceae bacterium]|jgi:Fe2+ transport system protein FeoA|nr:ferrous iron transport protein A [Chloroflexaceae bacterium]
MSTYTLADAPLGTPVRVVCIHNQGVERRRLYDLGITPGTELVAEMRSPLADPTAYRVRDALIALRRAQAVQIEVAVVEAGAIQ